MKKLTEQDGKSLDMVNENMEALKAIFPEAFTEDGVEYHTKNSDIVTKHNFSQEYLDYGISRQIELERYGYRFLRLNKFNLHLEQDGETKTDVLDRFLRKAFVAEC